VDHLEMIVDCYIPKKETSQTEYQKDASLINDLSIDSTIKIIL